MLWSWRCYAVQLYHVFISTDCFTSVRIQSSVAEFSPRTEMVYSSLIWKSSGFTRPLKPALYFIRSAAEIFTKPWSHEFLTLELKFRTDLRIFLEHWYSLYLCMYVDTISWKWLTVHVKHLINEHLATPTKKHQQLPVVQLSSCSASSTIDTC